MIIIHAALLFVACLVANILATVSGFGVSTILTPTLLYFFPIKETIFLVCIVHIFHDVIKLFFFYRSINLKLAAGFGLASIIASVVSSLLLIHWQEVNLSLILGLFLLSYAALLLLNPSFHVKKNWVTISVGGIVTGFIAGIFGIFGVIKSMFVISFDHNKKSFVGTTALISFLINITRMITYIAGGMHLNGCALLLLPFLIGLSFLGTIIGRYTVAIIPAHIFKTIVLLFIITAGILLIIKT